MNNQTSQYTTKPIKYITLSLEGKNISNSLPKLRGRKTAKRSQKTKQQKNG